MKLLEERIARDGKVRSGDVLKVDSFINHQLDIPFMTQLGKEFYRIYGDCAVSKILTVEASGIGIACLTAQFFNCPVIFAKKSRSVNIDAEVYSADAYSFTHKNNYKMIVSKSFLTQNDRVLIIDDFLANGSALKALVDLVEQSGATLVGCGIVIEKGYMPGGQAIRDKGIRVESLAKIKSMSVDGGIEFED